MKLIRSSESVTVDVHNWRRYGTYVPAGQIVTVADDEAAQLEARGAKVIDLDVSAAETPLP